MAGSNPQPASRRRARRLAAAFLAVQLAVPALWYLRSPDYDTRFAWRMFASTSAVRCTPEASVDGVSVDLRQRFGEVWVHRLEGGWQGVLDGINARLCEDGIPRVELRCVELDGTRRILVGAPCAP